MPQNRSRQRLDGINGNGRRWATYQAVADYLDVHYVTVKNMVADGRLRAYRLGSRVIRIDLNEVDAAFTPSEPVK